MRNNKVSDVIEVLTIIRNEQKKKSYYSNTAELRKEAIKQFAEGEFQAKRYLNLESAEKTIRDACTRRLKLSTAGFDKLTDEWLHECSMDLKDLLLIRAINHFQRAEVKNFFTD